MDFLLEPKLEAFILKSEHTAETLRMWYRKFLQCQGLKARQSGFLHPTPRCEFLRRTHKQKYPDMFRRMPGQKAVADFLRYRPETFLMPLREKNHG